MVQLDTVGLNNDEQFSNHEIRFIRDNLKDAEVELGHIDKRRRQVTDALCRYKIAIAPHKRLPEDVVRSIFEYFVEDYAMHFPFKMDEMRCAPSQVTLSHVCSTWRRIVLDMKSLWSHITIAPTKKIDNFLAFCTTWSPRILPHISVDLIKVSRGSEFWYSFWDSFSRFQFKEVELIMYDDQLDHCCLEFDATSIKVERVSLVIKTRYHSYDHQLRLPQFLSGPLYSCSLIDDIDVYFKIPNNCHLPWAQLRCLDLIRTVPSHLTSIIEALRQCTSLEVCSLNLRRVKTHDIDNEGVPMPMEPVTLPVLQKFIIYLKSDAEDLHELSRFVLPNLRILEIRGGKWTYDVREVFRNQLNFHQLYELDMAHVTSSPTIISILKDAPLLRRLSLSPSAMFDEKTLRGLGTGALGRHLEFLQLSNCSCDLDAIRQMVEARLRTRRIVPGIAPLFHVQFMYKVKSAQEDKFIVINNDMRIELCYT